MYNELVDTAAASLNSMCDRLGSNSDLRWATFTELGRYLPQSLQEDAATVPQTDRDRVHASPNLKSQSSQTLIQHHKITLQMNDNTCSL